MRLKKFNLPTFVLCIILLSFFLYACSKPKCIKPDVEFSKNIPSAVKVDETIPLSANADGTNLTFLWDVSDGEVESTNRPGTFYTAPSYPVDVEVVLQAKNGCGLDNEILQLKVERELEGLIVREIIDQELNKYLIESNDISKYEIGDSLTIYGTSRTGKEISIATVIIIAKNTDTVTVQAILIRPGYEIIPGLVADSQPPSNTIEFVPVYKEADGHLWKQDQVLFTSIDSVNEGDTIQVLEPQIAGGVIFDYFVTTEMRIMKLGTSKMIAQVEPIDEDALWPKPGSLIVLKNENMEQVKEVDLCSPDLTVEIKKDAVDNVVAGQIISLTAITNNENVSFSWNASTGEIDDPGAKSINYTVPKDEESATITVVAHTEGCEETVQDNISLAIMPNCEPFDISIDGLEVDHNQDPEVQIVAGSSMTLTAVTNNDSVAYNWQTDIGTIVDPSVQTITYEAPDNMGSGSISVEASVDGCESKRDEISIVVDSPPPTNTPLPIYSQPVITQLELRPGGQLVVCWNWDGNLGDKNYAIRFWRLGDPDPNSRHSITWTQSTCFDDLTIENSRFPPGTYHLDIAVMEGPSDGEHWAIVESEAVLVEVPHFTVIIPPDS